MANENLFFRKGTLAQLQANELTNKKAGSINFTTDEPAIYLDIEEDGSVVRKRIGDLITFETLAAFESYLNSHTKLPLTALYYITETNALLKYTGETGTPWKQLNNISDISGNVSDLQSALGDLTNTVNTLNENTYSKIEVDTELAKKADSETVNAELAKKANITDLNSLSSSVNTISQDYLTSTDKQELIENISTAQTQADKGVADAATAQAAADKAQREVDALETTVSNLSSSVSATYETKTDAANKLAEAKKATADLADGAVAENTQAINNEKNRAEDAEEALGLRIDGVQQNITNLSNSTTTSIQALQEKDEEIDQAIIDGNAATLKGAKDYADELKAASDSKDTELNEKIENLNSSLTVAIGEAKQAAINTVIGSESDTKDSNTIYGVRKYVDNALVAADAMTFKGVLGGAGNITSLPLASETKAGDTYKIGLIGEYAGYQCYVGDLLIAKEDGNSEYYHVTSGYEDDYNTRLGVDANNNKIILNSVTGADHGSIIFTAATDSSLTVNVEGEEDPITHMADSTVTLSLTWGSF